MGMTINIRSVSKKAGVVAAALLIFFSGWGIGSGHLSLTGFHGKPVASGVPANLNYSSVEQVYDALRRSYDGQLDQTKLLDGLKTGLVGAAGDPYTVYLNAKDAKQFDEDLNGTFEGVGAELGKDVNKHIIIVAPLKDTPAEKAGLKPKDIVAEINGKSAFDITVESAKDQIRGAKGTHVKLKIVRDDQAIDFDIVRDTIVIPSVTSKIMDGNIGYMQISRFGDDTVDLATKAAKQFADAKVKGVILDVRNDPGGLLDAAIKVSSLWLPNGKTVLDERRGGETIQTYRSSGQALLSGIPTIVLMNEGSASASEITAGALHDNGVAKLFGAKSFGKGSVQQLENFSDGSVLKVTIARWYTPKGINIDKEGIKPDTEVKLTDNDAKAGKDPQLDAAQAALR